MQSMTPAKPRDDSARIITPQAVLSYPHLFQPHQGKGQKEPLYSAALIFLAGTDLTPLVNVVYEVARLKWGANADRMIQAGQIRVPFRRGEEKGYPVGSFFFNARSKEKPGVVSRFAGPDGKPLPIVDPSEVYPGCMVRASITGFPYDTQQLGVGFALNNIQKLGEGERLDNRKAAQDEFDATEQGPAPMEGMPPMGFGGATAAPIRGIDDILGAAAPQQPQQNPSVPMPPFRR
jgi:hypothetical protein